MKKERESKFDIKRLKKREKKVEKKIVEDIRIQRDYIRLLEIFDCAFENRSVPWSDS